jgi:ketosteroid isomerase-like protein
LVTVTSAAPDEVQIRKMIDDLAQAIRVKSVDGRVTNYAPEIVLFALAGPLQNVGADAARTRVAEFLGALQGPVEYDVRDVSVTAGEDVAFCHTLNHVSAIAPDGQPLRMWWRATICCRKIEGSWKIVHEHLSVPFDVQTGKASLDLTP